MLRHVEISERKTVGIINNLIPNKAHGCDNISFQMLKICPLEYSKPLKLLYERCLQSGHYPTIWKKASVVPVH